MQRRRKTRRTTLAEARAAYEAAHRGDYPEPLREAMRLIHPLLGEHDHFSHLRIGAALLKYRDQVSREDFTRWLENEVKIPLALANMHMRCALPLLPSPRRG